MKEMMKRMGVDEDSVIMAHELTHALQDQHVGLKTLPLEVQDDDDLATASLAVVEGDATVAMMGWTFLKMGQPSSQVFTKMIANSLDQFVDVKSIPGAEAVENAPAFIRESLLFPYLGGLKFCITVGRRTRTSLPSTRP